VRVAIVHHWFVTRGGGERCAECIAALFPAAEVFTLVASERGLPESLRGRKLHTSFLQKIPGAVQNHRHMMPFYPAATRSLDLRGFDLVITSDSGPVKGARMDPGATQICYCYSPMRYLYDNYDVYRAQMGGLTRAVFTATAGGVRRFDLAASKRVDYFIAISNYIGARIKRFYGRDSAMIYPPIDLTLARTGTPGAQYLVAGRMVGYKRTELLMEACLRLGRRLHIVGGGPDKPMLEKLAATLPNPELVSFLGELPTDDLWQQYAECRALLFAADEDFGMVPLEAQACGRPVICYGAGGSLETVRGVAGAHGQPATGVYFRQQTVESAMEGILEFERREREFDPAATRAWAETFETSIFLEHIRRFVLEKVPEAASAMNTTAQAMALLRAGRR
jgi:glycosyltransferase involved in cell wall biosynthesis